MASGSPTTDIYPLLSRNITQQMGKGLSELKATWPLLWHSDTSKRRYEDVQTWIGRGLPERRDPREPLVYDGIAPNWAVRFLHAGHTQAECLAQEDIDDDEYGSLVVWTASRGGEFAVAWRTLEETLLWNYLSVTAFATAPVAGSPDGQPLASASHPTSRTDSTTWSNLISGDLNPTNYRQMVALLEKQVRPNGVTYIDNGIVRLFVNPDNREMATRIVQGAWEPDTTDRNMNVWQGKVKLVVSPYLKRAGTLGAAASPVLYNGWGVQCESHGLQVYFREKPTFDSWPDGNTRSVVFASHMRLSYGHTEAYGMGFGGGS